MEILFTMAEMRALAQAPMSSLLSSTAQNGRIGIVARLGPPVSDIAHTLIYAVRRLYSDVYQKKGHCNRNANHRIIGGPYAKPYPCTFCRGEILLCCVTCRDMCVSPSLP